MHLIIHTHGVYLSSITNLVEKNKRRKEVSAENPVYVHGVRRHAVQDESWGHWSLQKEAGTGW